MAEPPVEVRDEVAALARGLAVLKAVAGADRPISNRALADATGIPKATVSRLAGTLLAARYLRQDGDSDLYSLGPALLDMSNAYLRRFDMRMLARPFLAELADFAGASAHLGLRDGTDILVIETVRPHSAVILSRTDIGSRMHIASSASGRAYFAALDAAEQQLLRDALKAADAKAWPATTAALDKAVKECAAKGCCSSFQEWHADINALGFSLRGPRGELYAVSCGGPAYKLSPAFLSRQVAPKILQVQAAIAREVGQAAQPP